MPRHSRCGASTSKPPSGPVLDAPLLEHREVGPDGRAGELARSAAASRSWPTAALPRRSPRRGARCVWLVQEYRACFGPVSMRVAIGCVRPRAPSARSSRAVLLLTSTALFEGHLEQEANPNDHEPEVRRPRADFPHALAVLVTMEPSLPDASPDELEHRSVCMVAAFASKIATFRATALPHSEIRLGWVKGRHSRSWTLPVAPS